MSHLSQPATSRQRAEADHLTLREKILQAECPLCGSYLGSWCVTAGGQEIRDIRRQHADRKLRAGVLCPDEVAHPLVA